MAAALRETPVPPALISIVQRWREHGEPAQPASSWLRSSWLRQFPDHRSFLNALPDHIDRAEATHHAVGAVTLEGAEQAFLVAMIWGHGLIGYGAWRTRRVLTENPQAIDRLREVALVARDRGGLAAFRNLADKPLRYLGVAFGTKYCGLSLPRRAAVPRSWTPLYAAGSRLTPMCA